MEACCLAVLSLPCQEGYSLFRIPVIRWPRFLWLRLKLCLGCCCWDKVLQTDGVFNLIKFSPLMSSAFFFPSRILLFVFQFSFGMMIILSYICHKPLRWFSGEAVGSGGQVAGDPDSLILSRKEQLNSVSLFTSSSVVKQNLRWLIWGEIQGSF